MGKAEGERVEGRNSQGGTSQKVDEELDRGRFYVCTTCQKASEAHDDDTGLDCADEQRQSVRREEIVAERLDARKHCIICPELESIRHNEEQLGSEMYEWKVGKQHSQNKMGVVATFMRLPKMVRSRSVWTSSTHQGHLPVIAQGHLSQTELVKPPFPDRHVVSYRNLI